MSLLAGGDSASLSRLHAAHSVGCIGAEGAEAEVPLAEAGAEAVISLAADFFWLQRFGSDACF